MMSGLRDEKVQVQYGSGGRGEVEVKAKSFLKAKKCESKQWYTFLTWTLW